MLIDTLSILAQLFQAPQIVRNSQYIVVGFRLVHAKPGTATFESRSAPELCMFIYKNFKTKGDILASMNPSRLRNWGKWGAVLG
jgi:hypothetical protein